MLGPGCEIPIENVKVGKPGIVNALLTESIIHCAQYDWHKFVVVF